MIELTALLALERAREVDAEDDREHEERFARLMADRATHRRRRIVRHAAVLLCIDRLHGVVGSGFRPCPLCLAEIEELAF